MIDNLAHLIAHVETDSDAARETALDIESHLRTVVQQDENRIEEMKQASVVRKKVPSLVQKISEDLALRVISASSRSERAAKKGAGVALQVGGGDELRKQMREAIKRVQNLNVRRRSTGSPTRSKTLRKHGRNMIALNAWIQAAELGEYSQGLADLRGGQTPC